MSRSRCRTSTRRLAFYRDALGLDQIADWSSPSGRVVVLDAGRATLELLDEAQAEAVDAIEAGHRVSGTVRLAVKVADSDDRAGRLVAASALPAVAAGAAFCSFEGQAGAVDVPADDVADAEVEQFHRGVVVGEVAAVLDDLPELEVDRFDGVAVV